MSNKFGNLWLLPISISYITSTIRAIAEKSYILLGILSVLACLGLILGLTFQRRIEAWLSRRRADKD